MFDLLSLLWNTILLRPYVFGFLVLYLLSASLFLGVKKALVYIPLGYSVAWVSEWCSTHYGIPYGFYRYIPATMHLELWIGGIPFMDSLSYVFLSYAAYGTACLLCLKKLPTEIFSSWRFTFLGAFMLTILDVIIDPVALQGDKWFLGKIYEYPSGGIYFGVPLSNFAGWFAVGVVLMRILQWLGKRRLMAFSVYQSGLEQTSHVNGTFKQTNYPSLRVLKSKNIATPNPGLLLAAGLYVAVLLFNLAVTAYIGAWKLLAADFVVLCLSWLVFAVYCYSHTTIRERS